MEETAPKVAVLYDEDVRNLVRERANLIARQAEVAERLKQLQRKIEAVVLLLPPHLARDLVGDIEPNSLSDEKSPSGRKQRAEWPVTDLVEEALANERGGRTPAFMREKLASDPEVGARIRKSNSAVGNALARLTDRKKARKVGPLYYHPDVLAKIEKGEIKEEHQANAPTESASSLLRRCMVERGGRFIAKDAMAVAKREPRLARKLKENPGFVYSWLSRSVHKGNLVKDGDFYFISSKGNGEGPTGIGFDAGKTRREEEAAI